MTRHVLFRVQAVSSFWIAGFHESGLSRSACALVFGGGRHSSVVRSTNVMAIASSPGVMHAARSAARCSSVSMSCW